MAGHEDHPDPAEVDVHGHRSFLPPDDTPATPNRVFVHLHLCPKRRAEQTDFDWGNEDKKKTNLSDEERCTISSRRLRKTMIDEVHSHL